MSRHNSVVKEDLARIRDAIADKSGKFKDSNVFITGCCGFLGYYFLHFFNAYKDELGIKEIVAVDNFQTGQPEWLKPLVEEGRITFKKFDVVKDDVRTIERNKGNAFVIHMASIASPVFYRQFPIETIEANIWGLKTLLDDYKETSLRGFLFFSSSEIYGDPDPKNIPTSEEYRGNVAVVGPRACYDESKRLGETICYEYAKRYNLPIGVARPFNNFGPGMKLDDQRVPADFAKSIVNGQNIEILSDGSPTRTFCYISDAITGYLKILLHGQFDYFNIGIDGPEISIRQLAEIYAEAGADVFGHKVETHFAQSKDAQYLTDNPNRRCPVITKAKTVLGFNPGISVKEGVHRYLTFLKEERQSA